LCSGQRDKEGSQRPFSMIEIISGSCG
jgi:hypothetical protein